jgi:hypothetical protein
MNMFNSNWKKIKNIWFSYSVLMVRECFEHTEKFQLDFEKIKENMLFVVCFQIENVLNNTENIHLNFEKKINPSILLYSVCFFEHTEII